MTKARRGGGRVVLGLVFFGLFEDSHDRIAVLSGSSNPTYWKVRLL